MKAWILAGLAASLPAWGSPPAAIAPALDTGGGEAPTFDMSTGLRLNADRANLRGSSPHHATVLGVQSALEARDVSGGKVTVHVEPFLGVRLDGDGDSGNRVLLGADGRAADRIAWGYVGRAWLSVGLGDAGVWRVGLTEGVTDVLDPDTSRALPPSFRGVEVVRRVAEPLDAFAARFDAVIPRGGREPIALMACNSGQPIGSYTVAGVRSRPDSPVQGLAYLAVAQDAWRLAHAVVNAPLAPWASARVSAYVYRPEPGAWGGHMHGQAAGAYLRLGSPTRYLRLGLQAVGGHSYFDWIGESDGNDLGNAYAGDYNAPHERSFQVRVWQQGGAVCEDCPDLTAWLTLGHGADTASAGSPPSSSPGLRDLYLDTAGQPRRGSEGEYGVKLSRSWSTTAARWRASLAWLRYWRERTFPAPSYTRTQFVLDTGF